MNVNAEGRAARRAARLAIFMMITKGGGWGILLFVFAVLTLLMAFAAGGGDVPADCIMLWLVL